MKKIFRYILLLLLIIVVVRVFVYFLTKTYYKDFNNYKVLAENFEVNVTESKVAKNKGYIKGTVTNNSGEFIKNSKIKLDFYNNNGKKLGTEYELIEIFNVGEKVKFDLEFQYKEVSEIRINIINEQ